MILALTAPGWPSEEPRDQAAINENVVTRARTAATVWPERVLGIHRGGPSWEMILGDGLREARESI